MTPVATTCPYCGVGCGILATPTTLQGDPTHPANFGKLCSKGSALLETIDLEGRLLTAQIKGKPATLTKALDEVATRFKQTIAEHGAESVAFYVSGQLLTEDYYVANKLMKGFIGTGNIDTNSRLCMSSSVAGHKRAFGEDYVPVSYSDLEKADVVILVGSNLAWCHPVLFQRLLEARAKNGTKIVVIDPRKTMTAREADVFLPLKPDSDVALFTGLLKHIPLDYDYVMKHTLGVKGAVAQAPTIERVAQETELPIKDVKAFYKLFSEHEKVITLYSQGVNQSTSGTDKVNAIINAHLYAGRMGREGMGPFSITGQPNAMGGREVGGLANMLASHIDFDKANIVQRFWGSPTIAREGGLKAVDMFKAVKEGKIKALWIMATNPLHSMPESDEIDLALENCPFVVVSEIMGDTPLTAKADVMLPALAWGEKDGTVTNSERVISRQRPFLPTPQDAKADWWLIAQVAQRMDFEGFAYKSPAEIFNEHARLSAFENNNTRAFNLKEWLGKDYNRLEPKRWGEGFVFPKFKFIPTPLPVLPKQEGFKLNTGRIRDQWHTKTRTGKSVKLAQHLNEAYCEMNEYDAEALALKAGDYVQFKKLILKVKLENTMRAGEIFIPMHLLGVNRGVTAHVDAFSGQPALKQAYVHLTKYTPLHYFYGLSKEKPSFKQGEITSRVIQEGYAQEAVAQKPFEMKQMGEKIELIDEKLGLARFAFFKGDKLQSVYYLANQPQTFHQSYLEQAFTKDFSPLERLMLLSGQTFGESFDKGAIICACHGVGKNEILMQKGNYHLAGTGCGACKSEVTSLKHLNKVP
jgi:assimilatory nitrate reductase catalytic subunit